MDGVDGSEGWQVKEIIKADGQTLSRSHGCGGRTTSSNHFKT